MAEIPGQITLKELLLKFKLSHLYTTLTEQEFDSLEIIKECSEDDVSALCKSLNLCLLDKLRFKRALKSVHIPQHSSQYAIINKQEQNYIVAIDNSIKRMQHIVTPPKHESDSIATSNTQLSRRYKLNENVIHSSFDMLIGKLNQQRAQLLKQLKARYEDREHGNEEMVTHLNSAKHIKKQCHQLLMKDTNLNELDSRTKTIKTYNDQCLHAEKRIIDLKSKIEDTRCSINNISIKVQNDDEIQRFTNTFVTICHEEKDADDDALWAAAAITEHMGVIPQKNLMNHHKPSDTIDTQHDINLFTHNPVRAWKWSQTTNKWIRRGRGTVSLYYNQKQHLAKLIFVDDESHNTTLLQYVDENITSLKCVKAGCVSWESYDYSSNHQYPQKGLFIIKFIGNQNAASEFLEILNDQTEMLSDKNSKRKFRKIPYIAHSKSAQSVMDLEGSFRQSIAIKKLYCFGNDACWNIRASHTEIEFVRCTVNGKIKLIAKQREDGSLAMNHYIPVRNANLILKQDLVYQWNALDMSLTTWSAKFYTNRDAENFRAYFNTSVHYNRMIEMKRSHNSNNNIDAEMEKEASGSEIISSDILGLETTASKSVPPPQQNGSAAVPHQKPPKLATCKSWDGPTDTHSSSVVMVRPWSRYMADNDAQNNDYLEIISDHKQTEQVQDIEIGDENEFDLMCKVAIKSLHRWCIELQCWQIRAAQTNVLFYKKRNNAQVRLICKVQQDAYGSDVWTFKLNHWMPSNEVANTKYRDKQFLWSAHDYCVDNQGLSTFAVKFFNVEDADTFQRQFLNSNCSIVMNE